MRRDLEFFFEEDAVDSDLTSSTLPEQECVASIVAREECVLAGLSEAKEMLESRGLEVVFVRPDGEFCGGEEDVLKVRGKNNQLFSVVRAVLNLIGRMSGVASACREAELIAGKYGVKTAVTRKTLPGLRYYDKKAARIGGSWTHRRDLSDMFLFKKTHLAYFDCIADAVEKARSVSDKKIEVEATSISEALDVARAGADMVMLDNFSVLEAKKAIQELREFDVKIEVSGGVSMNNLESYCALKPDFVSMGFLTKCACSIDFSLRLLE